MNQNNYPRNLLDAVQDRCGYPIKLITDDRLAGLNYALSTLRPKEQEIIELHYQRGLCFEEISDAMHLSYIETRALCDRAIFRLRHPWVNNYITYGIVGYTLQKSLSEFFDGYRLGYDDAKDGKDDLYMRSKKPTLSLASPSIEILGLSKRTMNCLTRAGITTIGSCLMLREQDIRGIRGLGPVGADEVARAFVKSYIYSYNWEQFLFEPCQSRDWHSYIPVGL